MDENEKKQPAAEENSDDRIHVTKSVFKAAEEYRQAELEEQQHLQEELERQRAEREKKRQEEHDRRLYEEKKELIRLKQGLIEESETIHEEEEEEIKLTFFQKISNFFYHNKWWLGIGVVCAFVAVFLIYSLVTRERPDMIILVIGENYAIGEESALSDYAESFAEDFNGNGETLVTVYYIPYSDNAQSNYANGVDNKLTAELQSAESVIVIGNEKLDTIVQAETVFADLSEMYPDNANIDRYKFMLSGTDFAQKIGIEDSQLSDDWYMALRVPRNLMYSDKKDMQKTYDKDFPVFDAIVKDLSE